MAQPESAKKRSILITSEDWWSVYLGLFLLIVTFLAFASGSPLNVLKSAMPVAWPKADLGAHLANNFGAYLVIYLLLTGLTGIAVRAMGGKLGHYLASFTVLFVASLVILILGSQQDSKTYGLEYPFWALVLGLIVGNSCTLPEWFRAGAGRTEFFIKTGIVLLGANLPCCNTRIQDVRSMGAKPIIAFSSVVAVNFVVGLIMAMLLFGGIIAKPLG